jgi:hypothetical protein
MARVLTAAPWGHYTALRGRRPNRLERTRQVGPPVYGGNAQAQAKAISTEDRSASNIMHLKLVRRLQEFLNFRSLIVFWRNQHGSQFDFLLVDRLVFAGLVDCINTLIAHLIGILRNDAVNHAALKQR